MSNKPKKPKCARRAPLTRAQLLPTPVSSAREISLRNHLALVSLRNGQGNVDLASELIETRYLSYMLHTREALKGALDDYLIAERILTSCADET
jgi:hypothetical protein